MERVCVETVIIKLMDVEEEMDRLERHNKALENENTRLHNKCERLKKKLLTHEEIKDRAVMEMTFAEYSKGKQDIRD